MKEKRKVIITVKGEDVRAGKPERSVPTVGKRGSIQSVRAVLSMTPDELERSREWSQSKGTG